MTETVVIDGKEYTKEEVEEVIEKAKEQFHSIVKAVRKLFKVILDAIKDIIKLVWEENVKLLHDYNWNVPFDMTKLSQIPRMTNVALPKIRSGI